MKSRPLLLGVLLLLALSLHGAVTQGDLSGAMELRERFEEAPVNSAVAVRPAWRVVAGNVDMTDEVSFSGNSSLKITPTEPVGRVAFVLPTKGNSSVTFVDFHIQPVAPSSGEAANSVDAAGALVGFMLVGTDAKLFAFNAQKTGGTWRDAGASWPTNQDGSVSQWIRVTLRLDFTAKIWDLYVDGKIVAANLALVPAAARTLVLYGDAHAPVYVDDLYVGSFNPLFVDRNGDGLPDAWAAARRAGADDSMSGAGRDTIDSATGLSWLEEYQQAVEALSKPGKLYARPLVFVHPSLKSARDFASILEALAAANAGDSDLDRTFSEALMGDLKLADQAMLAGLPGPPWKLAPDLNTAAEIADSGSELIVFPSQDPSLLTSFNPHGKSLSIHSLPGVVISTSAALPEARKAQANERNKILARLPEIGSSGPKIQMEKLWPAPVILPMPASSANRLPIHFNP